jgi:hypothetical protein
MVNYLMQPRLTLSLFATLMVAGVGTHYLSAGGQ